jgi:hypothetical protein
MTRRNQRQFPQRQNRHNNGERHLMKKLDLRKVNYFKYDAQEIFDTTKLDEKLWNSLIASIVAKASRVGIKEAKEYIRKMEDEDVLPNEIGKELNYLLDKYKRWR